MIPRVSKPGHSFKGAALYYLHDKKAKTKERVAWTHINNIPTDDPDKAFNWMAYTAMNAHYLKQQAGVARTGRKRTAGPVYSFSLAWHPEQEPEKQTMLDSAFEVLNFLELHEHESVFVAHRDTAHPHVHVICNLIHPETGRKARISNDWISMSAWAEQVERADGEILCEQRVINNEQRRNTRQYAKQFGYVKHKEQPIDLAEHIQGLYNYSDSGKAFQAILKGYGYTLAKGDRRGFVLVDERGKVSRLSRQLKGQRAADIKERLSDLQSVPLVKDVLFDLQHFDRDKYEAQRQQDIVDAAIKAEQEKAKTKPKDKEQTPPNPDSEFLQKLDEQRSWEQKIDQRKSRLKKEQNETYKTDDKKKEIKRKEQELADLKKKKTSSKKLKSKEQELENLKKTLDSAEQRMKEQDDALEHKSKEERSTSKEDIVKQRTEELKRKMQEQRNKKRDNGPDRER